MGEKEEYILHFWKGEVEAASHPTKCNLPFSTFPQVGCLQGLQVGLNSSPSLSFTGLSHIAAQITHELFHMLRVVLEMLHA